MALRCAVASTEYLEITSGLLDHNSTYSVGGWFRATSLGGGNQWFWNAMSATRDFTDFDSIFISGGGNLRAAVFQNGGGSLGDNGAVVTTGVWNHIMLVRESATSFRVYLNGVTDTVNTTDISGRAGTAYMHLSTYYEGGSAQQGFDGRFFGWKAWQRALTASEVSAEMRQALPVSALNLYGVWPFLADLRPNDFSGKGHTWTEISTPSSEDPPNVAYGNAELIITATETAPAGDMTGVITASGALVGALTGTGNLTGGLTGTGTVAGTLTANGALTGVITANGALAGTLTAYAALTCAITANGALAGTLSAGGEMTGVVTSTGTLAGTLTAIGNLTGTVTATGTVTGTLTGSTDNMIGEILATGTLAGTMTAGGTMVGAVTATGTLIGLLQGEFLSTVVVVEWSVPFTLSAGEEWRVVFTGPAVDAPSVRIVPSFTTVA